MTTHIDHDQCSELLPRFVKGELAESEAEAVSAHLETCLDCSRERTALGALLGGRAVSLTADERNELDAAITSAVRGLRGAEGQKLDLHQRIDRRAARRWLGAAALFLVMGGVLYLGSQIGVDGGGGAAGQAVQSREETERGERAASEALDRAADAEAMLANALPQPLFVPAAGELTKDKLVRIGRRGAPFVALAKTYTVRKAREQRDEFLGELTDAAPKAHRDQVRSCTRVVLVAEPYPLLPAYGALGKIGGRTVLALGFAWSTKKAGPLDRFMLWAWPTGSCDSPAAYHAGFIKH